MLQEGDPAAVQEVSKIEEDGSCAAEHLRHKTLSGGGQMAWHKDCRAINRMAGSDPAMTSQSV